MAMISDLQYHTKLKFGDLGRYVLLPGDPGRVESIAKYFNDSEFVADSREHKSYRGTLLDERIGVLSTGMGCPSTAIAMEELINIGVDTFIRVGTSGSLQPNTKSGDIAIITSAIRDEGTTRAYLPIEYPAIADINIVNCIIKSAKKLNINYRKGISHTKDSFYAELYPDTMPMSDEIKKSMEYWKKGGAICSEMESSSIFILSSIYRKRSGAIAYMYGNDSNLEKPNLEPLIQLAIESLKEIITFDREKNN